MKPKVLILSSIYDFSTDLVALCLREKNISFLRLNRENLGDFRIAMNPVEPTMYVTGSSVEAEINSSLCSVWFRQPVFLRNTPPYPLSPTQQLERSQWSAFLRSLSVFDKAYWMNFPQATYLAECKPYQLLTAARSGFLVPSTLVGNHAKAIKALFKDGMVVKSLDTVLLREGEDCLFTYTTISESNELSDENIATAPLLAQELLFGKTDIRVTLVGNAIFAVHILADGTGVEGDWRVYPREALSYESIKLKSDIERSCRKLVKKLGLSFAAIDLAETPKGTYFIEVNPTGEWGWIKNAERPIDVAIASWLSDPTQA